MSACSACGRADNLSWPSTYRCVRGFTLFGITEITPTSRQQAVTCDLFSLMSEAACSCPGSRLDLSDNVVHCECGTTQADFPAACLSRSNLLSDIVSCTREGSEIHIPLPISFVVAWVKCATSSGIANAISDGSLCGPEMSLALQVRILSRCKHELCMFL